MGTDVAGAVAVEAELVTIVDDPQKTAVGVTVLIMAAHAGKFASGAAAQATGGHGRLQRRLGAGSGHRVGAAPAVGGLMLNSDSGQVRTPLAMWLHLPFVMK